MRYLPEHLEFLKTGYASMKIEDLAAAFNEKFETSMSAVTIKSALQNHKIRCGRKHGERLITRSRLFTPEQEEFLKDNYKHHTISQLTILINKEFDLQMTEQQLKTYTTNHNIFSGRPICFKKGQKPLGHERTNKRKRDGFILIKVSERNPYTGAPTRYKHKHVHVWEQEFGAIPDGMVVAFKDGNRLNCDKKNLMLISRAELLRLNQYNYKDIPEELKSNYLALAKLEVKTFRLSKKER